jgi:hypothetical protein
VAHVAVLDWFNSTTYPPTAPPWDVILVADCVWLDHLVSGLVHTLVTLCHDQTVVLLSHQTRSQLTDALLFDSLRPYFLMSIVQSDGKIVVWRLKRV